MVLFGIFRSDLGCLEASKSSEKSQFFLSVVNLHHGECFGSSDLPSQIENLKPCSNSRTVWQCGWLAVVGKRCCCETVAFRERLQCVKIWLQRTDSFDISTKHQLLPVAGRFFGQTKWFCKVSEPTLAEIVLSGVFGSGVGCLGASGSSGGSRFFLSVVNLGNLLGSSGLPSQIENLKP